MTRVYTGPCGVKTAAAALRARGFDVIEGTEVVLVEAPDKTEAELEDICWPALAAMKAANRKARGL